MRTVTYRLADLKNLTINLGFVGENEHTVFRFDCMKAFEEYPDAVPSLAVTPPNGDPYPAVTIRDGDYVEWTINDSDVAQKGNAEAQLTFIQDNVVMKDYIFRTKIERSILPTGEAPDPIQTWIDEANEALGTISGAVEDAEEARDAAIEAKNDAETAQGKAEDAQNAAEIAQSSAEASAQSASGYADSASESATNAQESAESAAESAASIHDDADRAVQAKEDAEDARDDARTYAGNAEQSAGQASASATTATTKAGEASDSASAAAESATTASNKAGEASNSATSASGSATSANADALKAEGYAVGKQNGTDVSSSSPYYHKNAKYYADSAAQSAEDAQDVLDSIPQDYTQLSNNVSNLKSALSADENVLGYATDGLHGTGLYTQTATPLTPENSVINSSGNATAGDSFRHLEKSVSEGDVYFVSGYKYSNSFPCYLFLNGSTVVSYETGRASGAFTDIMIAIPSGVNKLIVNGSSTNVPVIATRTFIKAATKTDVSNVDSYLAKKYQAQTVTTDVGVYSKGNSYNSNSGFKHTIVSVTEGEQYKITTYRVSDTYPAYVFRNSSGVVSYESTLSNGKVTVEVAVPSGATEMIINSSSSVDIVLLKKVNVIAAAESDMSAKAEKPNNWEEAQGTLTEGKIYGSPSSIVSGTDWQYRSLTSNSGFESGKVKINGVNFNSIFALYCFLDGNGTLISKATGLSDGTVYEDYVLTSIPEECRTIIVNNVISKRGDDSTPQIFVANGTKTVDDCAIFYAKREASKAVENYVNTGYEGKTIAFFGTSIMSAAVWNIPRYVKDILRCEIVNEALGSSCARRGWKSRETANDPYGWTGTSWQNVFLAMGASLAEKNDLITNYESKWGDLLGGDYEGSSGDGTGTGKPETLSDEWKAKIRGASYENKLIPYLDGRKAFPDLFVFEHGYNDYDPNDPLNSQPQSENSVDMSLYGDAMYFYIRKIFEANPQAKVMICSHYERQTARGQDVFAAQKALSEYHGLWFCNVADQIGWTQRLVTTTGYWDQTTHLWIPSGGQSQTITRKQQCLFDDLHPHNDWSGNASRREGYIIAQYIKSHLILET